MSNPLGTLMPHIFEHRGVWKGEYQHIDISGEIIDRHTSRVECVFPEQGDEVFIQKNHFTWPDGREHQVEFGGIIRDNKIWWDTETFSGYGWEASPGLFLLELDRKDLPNARFSEAIVMGDTKHDRVRTWHWFQDGVCFKRTLCNERLVSSR